jgi:hypothetical protein
MTKISNNTLLATALLLAVLLAGVAAEKLMKRSEPSVAITLPLDKTCDLQKSACSVKLPDGGSVTLSIAPRPIPVLQPLQLEVTVGGAHADKVEVDFSGVDMKMGFNRPQLQAQSNGRFSGQATLPICSVSSMAWRATVLLETGDKLVAAPFEFVTTRN